MTVSDIMNKDVVSVSPDESVSLASRLMSRHNIGSLPVCTEEGKLQGIITDRDIVLRCVANGSSPDMTAVGNIMSKNMITVSPEDDIARAASLMSSGQVRRLPVTQRGVVVGVVALADLAVNSRSDMEAARALSEISSGINRI